VVYLAEDLALQREVALKMLSGVSSLSQATRDRFQREAQLTSRLQHVGICGVHEIGDVDGTPYIAMQYVRGQTLAESVARARGESAARTDSEMTHGAETISITASGGKSELTDVVRLIERAARALHAAHEAGLIHRDIKPGNIMVTPEGRPVLLDFGLARDVQAHGQTITETGQILGTPAYLSAEQISAKRGVVDRRSDVYGLGVTLYECITLRRPFYGATWDQLFMEILQGECTHPRKINPRIPRDLCTVIETAMARDQTRRYPTAEALADDLLRVLRFEPIHAKAPGPATRLMKWARRRPGVAVAAATGVLFASAGVAIVLVRAEQNRRELREHIAAAESALAAEDYTTALVEVAQARALKSSVAVLDLEARVKQASDTAEREARRKADLAAAVQAREDAVGLQARYAETRRQIDERDAELLRAESGVRTQYATDEQRGDLARRERERRALAVEAERALLRIEEALQRAARNEAPWGGVSEQTERALADFYMERWREATKHRDEARASAMRVAVEQHDAAGIHRSELLGRGSLTVAVQPPSAECHLFRFESNESIRDGAVIPRLVPTPTSGVGRVAVDRWWNGAFRPGDPCLRVISVESNSPAADAGLAAGDLIVSLQGAPCGAALFVAETAPGSDLERVGVEIGAAVLALDGEPLTSVFDWTLAATRAGETPLRVRFGGRSEELERRIDAIRCVSAAELIEGRAPTALKLACLHDGATFDLEVPAGAESGLRCELTANPLICSSANRVDASASLVVDPGSYLLLARAPGFDEQRFAVFVDRLGEVRANVELLPVGSTPPGFVYVPPGAFLVGGDPQAFGARESEELELEGFAIGRKEVTNREWYEFVNDPETLAKIAASPNGAYLPRDERVFARKGLDGVQFTPDVFKLTSMDAPVLGLSWSDIREYLDWRNRRAAEAGEPWRYDLPTEAQWEKAARGVDGRRFPWGDRFDPALTVCMTRKPDYLLDAPGGFEPRDESPYGVLDLAGSRDEWLRDEVPGSSPPRYRKHGGHWGTYVEAAFRAASRGDANEDTCSSTQGFRLVLREP